jgi:hypothetical protein
MRTTRAVCSLVALSLLDAAPLVVPGGPCVTAPITEYLALSATQGCAVGTDAWLIPFWAADGGPGTTMSVLAYGGLDYGIEIEFDSFAVLIFELRPQSGTLPPYNTLVLDDPTLTLTYDVGEEPAEVFAFYRSRRPEPTPVGPSGTVTGSGVIGPQPITGYSDFFLMQFVGWVGTGNTGTVTLRGTLTQAAFVPEPSTLAMLTCGLALFALRFRR